MVPVSCQVDANRTRTAAGLSRALLAHACRCRRRNVVAMKIVVQGSNVSLVSVSLETGALLIATVQMDNAVIGVNALTMSLNVVVIKTVYLGKHVRLVNAKVSRLNVEVTQIVLVARYVTADSAKKDAETILNAPTGFNARRVFVHLRWNVDRTPTARRILYVRITNVYSMHRVSERTIVQVT